MPRKKNEELEAEGNSAEVSQEDAPEEISVEASAGGNAENSETREEPSIVESVLETVASAVGSFAGAVSNTVETVVSAVTGDSSTTETAKPHQNKRAEKIGIVQSDKMTKTVTVRVDRQVKHPIYRKYIKRRKKFMAHDELGSAIGDKVRIMETRPLSARKRWRVVEIIQKAEK